MFSGKRSWLRKLQGQRSPRRLSREVLPAYLATANFKFRRLHCQTPYLAAAVCIHCKGLNATCALVWASGNEAGSAEDWAGCLSAAMCWCREVLLQLLTLG